MTRYRRSTVQARGTRLAGRSLFYPQYYYLHRPLQTVSLALISDSEPAEQTYSYLHSPHMSHGFTAELGSSSSSPPQTALPAAQGPSQKEGLLQGPSATLS